VVHTRKGLTDALDQLAQDAAAAYLPPGGTIVTI
jgi:hypothetical protein